MTLELCGPQCSACTIRVQAGEEWLELLLALSF